MTIIEELAYRYADRKGFLLQKLILKYLRQGDSSTLDQMLNSPESRAEWEKLFNNNVEFAYTSFEYSWSQACIVVIQAGIHEREVSSIFSQNQHKLRKSGTIKKILDLNTAFYLQLVDCVSAYKLDKTYSILVQNCRVYIRTHINEPITVASIASAINYSRSYLSQIYRKETGETVYSFILNEKLDIAKQLLLLSGHQSKDIWKELGFCSQSHFTTFFKKMTGQTPSEFLEYSQTLDSVDELELGKEEMLLHSFNNLTPTYGMTEEYTDIMNGLYDYAEETGFKQEMFFMYCVKKGRTNALETEFSDPQFIKTLEKLFSNNSFIAYSSFMFLLPQIHSMAIEGGLSMKRGAQLYELFARRARGAEVPKILELLRDAFLEFATCVAENDCKQ